MLERSNLSLATIARRLKIYTRPAMEVDIAFAPFQLDTGFFRGVRQNGTRCRRRSSCRVAQRKRCGCGQYIYKAGLQEKRISEGGNVERRRGFEGSWDSNHWPQRRAHKRARHSGLPTSGFPHSISLLRRSCGSCGRAAPVDDYVEALGDAFYVIGLGVGIRSPVNTLTYPAPPSCTKYVNCGASNRIIRPLFREAQ